MPLYGPLRHYEDERNRDPKGIGDFYLICDFNPDKRDNASEDFGACLTWPTICAICTGRAFR